MSSQQKVFKPASSSSSTNNVNTSSINTELEQQFEIELCWCIQQLQKSLNSGKLNKKQIQDTTKVLNTLMSNSAPMIKKRQVMRVTFGDYRAKMATEDKKLNKAFSNVKIAPASPNKKSIFVKKSLGVASASAGFKFDFPEPREVEDNNLSSVEITSQNMNSNYNFESNNSFKFNFADNVNEQS